MGDAKEVHKVPVVVVPPFISEMKILKEKKYLSVLTNE